MNTPDNGIEQLFLFGRILHRHTIPPLPGQAFILPRLLDFQCAVLTLPSRLIAVHSTLVFFLANLVGAIRSRRHLSEKRILSINDASKLDNTNNTSITNLNFLQPNQTLQVTKIYKKSSLRGPNYTTTNPRSTDFVTKRLVRNQKCDTRRP